MRNIGLDEAQDGIKIAGRNINNLRYADDINEPKGKIMILGGGGMLCSCGMQA